MRIETKNEIYREELYLILNTAQEHEKFLPEHTVVYWEKHLVRINSRNFFTLYFIELLSKDFKENIINFPIGSIKHNYDQLPTYQIYLNSFKQWFHEKIKTENYKDILSFLVDLINEEEF
jgi:hypothetical protein